MRIAVGGTSRKAGKTAVICALIRATPEAGWTAIKVTPHAHGPHLAGGDTARYLAAGARAARLVAGALDAWPEGNAIVESGAAAGGDLYIAVVDPGAEFKPSAAALIERADAFVVTRGEWRDAPAGRPVFSGTEDLIDYVKRRL